MKKILLLSLAVCIFLVQDVLAAPSEAVFSTSFSNRIQLILNGQIINHSPGTNVYIRERAGIHAVKILVFNKWGRLISTHYDRVRLHPHSHNQFLLEIHPFGRSRLRLVNLQKLPNQQYRPTPHHGPAHRPTHRLPLMSDDDFYYLQEELKMQRNDKCRMLIARNAFGNKLLSSEDVRELLYLFDYEDSRLAFAKLASSRLSDPENFTIVYEVFRYNSSIIQLEEFLARTY